MRQVVSTVKMIFLAAIFFNAVTSAHMAHAQPGPSFDCTKISNNVEKQICQSPKLSELDLKLDAGYKATAKNLSAEGRKSLRASQRSWLVFIKAVCDPSLRPEIAWSSTEDCLAEKLKERERQLQDTTVKTAAMTIYPFSQFTARRNAPGSDQSGHDSGFTTTQVSYPLIDGPDSPFKLKFQKAHAKFASRNVNINPEETDTDYLADYKVLKENARLLSIEVSGGFYAHGTPHGQYYSLVFHWLPKEGRELRSTDIFDSSKPWQRTLQSFCYEDLLENIGQVWGSDDLEVFIEKFGSTVVDPERWTFDEKGLKIHFLIYEVAAYAYGQPEVTVPWSQLQDYLVPGALPIINR